MCEAIQTSLQRASSSQSLGFIGIVRVLIFFFVTAFGMTMSVGVIFSHRSESASVMRAAVNLQVDRAARHIGLTSSMTASNCSAVSVNACPDLFDFGISCFK